MIHTDGERVQVMVSRKSRTGIFSSRTTSGLFGDRGESNSVFGKARSKSEYFGDEGKPAPRKSGWAAHHARKRTEKQQGKTRKARRQVNKVGG